MTKRVKYTCKNCGWETSIRAEWADLKPKRCMNKKCNTSFLASPKDLIIERPEKPKPKPKPVTKKDEPKVEKKEEKSEKSSNSKQKSSRKSFKQQDEEKDSN